MDSKTYRAILSTVCYSDVFDYPLTEEEVFHFTCHPERSEGSLPAGRQGRDSSSLDKLGTQNDMRGNIKRANGLIAHKNRFMFLKGRERIVAQRLEREKISKEKLLLAEGIVSILKGIPTIRLVGVSGSVAMRNARDDDDIDLFIIARAGTMWLTRLLSIIAVELLGQRRRPGDINVADKICFNMFVDENFLAIPIEKRNLYTAHEVYQLRVLYDRDGTYSKFVTANAWARKYLPNGIDIRTLKYSDIKQKKEKERPHNILVSQSLSILNALSRCIQLWYMRRHQTSEVVTDHYLAFHPKDYTQDVLTAFKKRLHFYGSKV